MPARRRRRGRVRARVVRVRARVCTFDVRVRVSILRPGARMRACVRACPCLYFTNAYELSFVPTLVLTVGINQHTRAPRALRALRAPHACHTHINVGTHHTPHTPHAPHKLSIKLLSHVVPSLWVSW